jgi:hypothetical protein
LAARGSIQLKIQRAPGEDLVVERYAPFGSVLELPEAAPSGRYVVQDESEGLVAELHKGREAVRMYLPPGPYLLSQVKPYYVDAEPRWRLRRWAIDLDNQGWRLDSAHLPRWEMLGEEGLRGGPAGAEDSTRAGSRSRVSATLRRYLTSELFGPGRLEIRTRWVAGGGVAKR